MSLFIFLFFYRCILSWNSYFPKLLSLCFYYFLDDLHRKMEFHTKKCCFFKNKILTRLNQISFSLTYSSTCIFLQSDLGGLIPHLLRWKNIVLPVWTGGIITAHLITYAYEYYFKTYLKKVTQSFKGFVPQILYRVTIFAWIRWISGADEWLVMK